MKSIRQIGTFAAIVAVAVSLAACDDMSRQGRDTAVGAGLGGAAGAVVGGNALSTIGGAAAGGVIGHEVGK
ncbi:glycine zipper 2TM domain-containing protein [Paraburkholderia aromaticivorans]|uniref:glycine zipper 2TM domain-containing protein n=1 Tax=Paraburkholderia aromaticivorans TaxID=2026199 RepID=UPI001455E6F7|nr:glycine zipper 2TM domain-containing protein [Paraburkholderia aromaticivorans]